MATAFGQGTFQNLNFESTMIQQMQSPGPVDASVALPSWVVYYGTNLQTNVLYGAAGHGGTFVDLLGTNVASPEIADCKYREYSNSE